MYFNYSKLFLALPIFSPLFILYLRLIFKNKNKWETKNEKNNLEELNSNKKLMKD